MSEPKEHTSVACWAHYHRDCVNKNWCTCACHAETKEQKR